MNNQASKKLLKKTNQIADKQTNKQTNKQTKEQTNKRTNKGTNKTYTNKQTSNKSNTTRKQKKCLTKFFHTILQAEHFFVASFSPQVKQESEKFALEIEDITVKAVFVFEIQKYLLLDTRKREIFMFQTQKHIFRD